MSTTIFSIFVRHTSAARSVGLRHHPPSHCCSLSLFSPFLPPPPGVPDPTPSSPIASPSPLSPPSSLSLLSTTTIVLLTSHHSSSCVTVLFSGDLLFTSRIRPSSPPPSVLFRRPHRVFVTVVVHSVTVVIHGFFVHGLTVAVSSRFERWWYKEEEEEEVVMARLLLWYEEDGRTQRVRKVVE
ncbi:hypothetical protein MtrunA17_Chr1g0155731 [Medicago truncatula]|uniref:Transmembrane protein, putative n=1 Tax=Medicago truncatula TaxID=3880 RepID=G7I5V3_MEDTR|nr:transmembrane protein, putative [Medicago truncatula]RHN77525.1 hypothetical protein MtrunA17_Chr1g0155731 [Medicago truncatula]